MGFYFVLQSSGGQLSRDMALESAILAFLWLNLHMCSIRGSFASDYYVRLGHFMPNLNMSAVGMDHNLGQEFS